MNDRKITKALAAVQALLSRNTPPLPSKVLRSYVEKYYSWAKTNEAILKKEPPPFYLLDTRALQERALKFRSAFSAFFPDAGFYFAMKSNNHPDVSRTLLQNGFGLDVSSGLELETALGLGAGDIIFSGPGKTVPELNLAVEHADKTTILIDSFLELERLEKAASQAGSMVGAGVRLTTMPNGLWRKFGILLEELPSFFTAADACPHIRLKGLQFHTSWNMRSEAQVAFIRKLGKAVAGLSQRHRKQISFVDIGGGYWPESGEWLCPDGTPEGSLLKMLGIPGESPLRHFRIPADPIDAFAETIGQSVTKHLSGISPCRINFEPGRWICNESMHLFLSVVDKKGKDLVITDAGTNATGWERYETDYCPVLNLSRPSLKEKTGYVLGSLCTPHDVWGRTYFGEDILPGDFLMIPGQGAYVYSLRQHFIKPLPRVVVI